VCDSDYGIHTQSATEGGNNQALTLSPAFDVCEDPATTELVEKVTGWIQDCVDTHDSCGTPVATDGAKPRRLLAVNGRLALTSPPETVRYAALTYCWGGYDGHRTLHSNVTARYESIDMADLPQTLKDAIFFTRKLGIDYIWIDALCIVQDNGEEWALEAAKMADVYAGAHVVLAATRAKSATEGFLQPSHVTCTFSSHATSKRGFTLRAIRSDHLHGDLSYKGLPLFQRGWCLQEELLATRIVHFLPSEV
jgi:hypothetical protein